MSEKIREGVISWTLLIDQAADVAAAPAPTILNLSPFMENLSGTCGDRTIENTSMQESCEYDYGYVSCHWIGLERVNSFVTSTGGAYQDP
ncbi:MAG TPA: hypothetical protein VF452_03595 [Candidatus Binatia bacterium]